MVLRTNKNAPNFRLIVVDIEHPEEENWTTLIEVYEHQLIILSNLNSVHSFPLEYFFMLK